jgi:hypothetical protein
MASCASVLTVVTEYQNMTSCHEDISRQLSDLCDFLRGRTASKAYPEQDRIQVARLTALTTRADRHSLMNVVGAQ